MSWSQTPRQSTRETPESVGERWEATARSQGAQRSHGAESVGSGAGPRQPVRRAGPSVGVGLFRITPTRVTLAVALVGSVLFLLYAITVRDTSQIPLLSSGAGVLG